MYLHAPWATRFDPEYTFPDPFFVNGTRSTSVPTMRRRGDLRVATGPGFRVVELPYRGQELAMDVILPDARDGVAAVEASLTAEGLASTFAALEAGFTLLLLPRFRVATPSVSLRDALSALGMASAFDASRADFTGIANPPNAADRLSLSDAFHKVFVEVNEEGTEAAAATGGRFATRGIDDREPTRFVVDHPFLFVIRDLTTGAVLFMGRVVDPRGA